MLQLRVHRFSVPILRAYYGETSIQIKRSSSLYPLLVSTPRILNNTSLQAHVHISGSDEVLRHIQPEAGHTLYRIHTDMLMQWMYAHFLKGQPPYSAMVEFYAIYGITEDDMPFDTAYKIWQRLILKKIHKSHLYFLAKPVHTYTNGIGDRREVILRHLAETFQGYALDILHHHPIPPDYMVRRFLMKTLYTAGWSQRAIAASFGTSQQLVSHHISQR